MTCFDGRRVGKIGRNLDSEYLRLPRGVGMTVDRSTGRIASLAIQLTYPAEGSRAWMDGHTGAMFALVNVLT
jgi:hypothetical protein